MFVFCNIFIIVVTIINPISLKIMPKRQCPFDNHLSPQLKVHVGPKQVSNGVNKEQEMSKVYARTLSLLKNGSKKFEQKLSLHHQSEGEKKLSPENNSEYSEHKSSSPLRQMIFDSTLKLRPSKNDINFSEQETCLACKTTAVLAYSRCFYCNNFKCPDCMKECIKCDEYFCEKCSLIVYEGGEHAECLACYR